MVKDQDRMIKDHMIKSYELPDGTVPKIEDIPKDVHSLKLRSSYDVTDDFLSRLSDDICFLDLSFCKQLRTLAKLPKNLKILKLYDCDNLSNVAIKNLPKNLKVLVGLPLNMTDGLLADLPRNLQELHVYRCGKLKKLPNLPDDLEVLRTSDCNLDPEVLDNLPKKLRRLFLGSYSHPISVDEAKKLPEILESLGFIGSCDSITKDVLAHLPKNLKHLDLSGCHYVRNDDLMNLPIGLETLVLNSDFLTEEILDHLPKSLKAVDIQYCPKISSFDRNDFFQSRNIQQTVPDEWSAGSENEKYCRLNSTNASLSE